MVIVYRAENHKNEVSTFSQQNTNTFIITDANLDHMTKRVFLRSVLVKLFFPQIFRLHSLEWNHYV